MVLPSLSVAQMRARAAKQKADSALSSTGRIADQTICAQAAADDAIAKARSVRGEVESRIAELTQRAEANTSSVLGEFTGEVKLVVEQTQAQTSHAVGSAVQQLEKEIEVAASSATATSERATQMAVADVRRDFQAQLEQTRAEVQRRDVDAKLRMDEIAASLATLTDQLNRFKPASVADVSGSQMMPKKQLWTLQIYCKMYWLEWKIWGIMFGSWGKKLMLGESQRVMVGDLQRNEKFWTK